MECLFNSLNYRHFGQREPAFFPRVCRLLCRHSLPILIELRRVTLHV